MNRITAKLLQHKEVIRLAVVLCVLVVALAASAVGMEAGPWDVGP